MLLKVTGDGEDGKRTLREIGAELVKFAAQKAVATVEVNTKKARIDLAGLEGALKGLSGQAKVDLQITGAEAKLDQLRARLARLGTLDASPKVDIRIGQTVTQIETLEARIDALKLKHAEVEVDVGGNALAKVTEIEAALTVLGARDVSARVKVDITTALAELAVLRREIQHSVNGGVGAKPLEGLIADVGRAGAAFEQLGTEAVGIGAKVGEGLSNVGFDLGQAVSGFGTKLLSGLTSFGVALAVILPILAIVLPFVVSLGGAVVALGASLVSAAAGAGVLGIALLGAFGPVGAVVAFVAFQIAKVVEAQKKQEAATATAKNALVSQQQAQANLAKAQATESDQRIAALQAEKDATLALADATNAAQNASLGVEGARLNLEHAEADLAAFRKDAGTPAGNSVVAKLTDVATSKLPGALDGIIQKNGPEAQGALDYKDKLFAVKQALQDVKNSELGVKDAQSQRAKAQATVNDFQVNGLKAFDGYAQALAATETAERSLTKATTTLNEADSKRDEVLKSLSPTQSKFADALKAVQKTLSDDLGPAADKVFGGLTDGINSVSNLLADPTVQKALLAIGTALGDVIRTLGATIDTRGFKDSFAALAQGGADLTRIFGGRVLPDVLRLLLAIATDALPSLKRGASGLADAFHGFVDAELSGNKLKNQIHTMVSDLKLLGGLGKAAIGVLIALFPEARSHGDSLVTAVTKLLNRLKSILGTTDGKDKLKKFFDQSVDSVRTLWHLMVAIATVIDDTAKTLKTIKNVGEDLLNPGKTVKSAVGGGTLGGIAGVLTNLNPATLPLNAAKLTKKLLGLAFGADGGIATGPVIAGEAGHEALIPLRDDVLARLGRAIASYTPSPSVGIGHVTSAAVAGGSIGGPSVRNTQIVVQSPAGTAPDQSHMLASLDQRLRSLGA